MKGELAESMKQGIICFIPKPNKDSTFLDNWHPITLLNSDYKLLACIYAEKLKPCLADIISNTQSGFLKGRHIYIYEMLLSKATYIAFKLQFYILISSCFPWESNP